MGKLVIKLDKPIIYGILEGNQLLMMEELPADNVSVILDKVGSYPITEVAVYMKFDTRQDIEGVAVDRVVTDSLDYTFKISPSDYDFLKALAIRFNAGLLSIYSAYKHYTTMITDGIVVDSYIDQNFVVAGIQDGKYRSLNICSAERLQRTIESCKLLDVTYAASGVIPALGNIELIPADLHETLYFLQFILNGQASYQVNIDSGEVLEYGDRGEEKKLHVLEGEEERIAVEIIAKNLGTKTVAKKRTITFNGIFVTVLCLIIGAVIGIGLTGIRELDSRTALLENQILMQYNQLERQEFEKRFLENGILDETAGLYHDEYKAIQSVIGNNGAIISLRFTINTIEMTLFVIDEPMQDRAVASLKENYQIVSSEFEKLVENEAQGQAYLQYNIVLEMLTAD